MQDFFSALYYRLTLQRPLLTGVLVLLFIIGAVYFAQNFELDASADSLVLENDKDLRYYRALHAHYGSDDFLVITYTPHEALFSKPVIDDLKRLRTELKNLADVKSVTSILEVPLIDSPRMNLAQIQAGIRTLEMPDTDLELARQEFTNSPLYRSLLTSPDGRTTALLVYFQQDAEYQSLLKQRDALWEKNLQAALTETELAQIAQLSQRIKHFNTRLQAQVQGNIAQVRTLLQPYREKADIHLGGVPMVAADMIDFIRSDINTFGIGVTLFIVALLALAFQRIRWVLVPLLICTATVITTVGFLGMMEWKVTIVSSNFISLLLIITLSLAVHLIVRHQELHAENPNAQQASMLKETLSSKLAPSYYATITTMVAFASLIISGIRPVIDFGWMMVVGVGFAFALTFLLMPVLLVRFSPGKPVFRHHDITATITASLANLIERFNTPTLIFYLLLIAFSITGISRLTVENRFIDYFKSSTEIYQGMLRIDQQLGGTTSLDVVLEPSQGFLTSRQTAAAPSTTTDEEDAFADLLTDNSNYSQSGGLSGSSYWYNIFQLETVKKVHAYLDALPETGKVLSMATTIDMITQLNDGKEIDNFSLAVMYEKLPPDIKSVLFNPYMSEDGNQVRFSVRVIDSDKNLLRNELLKKIHADLVQKLGLEEQQVHLSGMLVLYNNVLQSLFKSQILTLSAVFLAIMLMLWVLFNSLFLAIIGVIPTVIAASLILGLMGWLSIPLDIMTITIAAITIGIGVDNTIHYIHRFKEEYGVDRNYWATVKRCHRSVGRAIYYTAITITLGFSILALSNFIPTIYFGLFTGLAMLVALVANLTLLPVLLVKLKPLH